MKVKQIRIGVFETNSSSTHTITICSPEQLEELKNGTCKDKNLIKAYDDIKHCELASYVKFFVTPKGEKIVIFGSYGYDG